MVLSREDFQFIVMHQLSEEGHLDFGAVHSCCLKDHRDNGDEIDVSGKGYIPASQMLCYSFPW